MRKKIYSLSALLLLLWPVAAMMNSCGRPCNHVQCHYFTAVDLKVVDNADSTQHDPVNNEVIAKAMLLQMQVHDSLKQDSMGYCKSPSVSNPFISSAFAIYKACEPDKENDVLHSFTITSDHDFDAAHPANTDLQDLFYTSSKPPYNHSGIFDFYLINEPTVTGTHSFTVKLVYSNGKTLSATTSPIKLLK